LVAPEHILDPTPMAAPALPGNSSEINAKA
jgi:hypothetical protein